MPIGAPPDLFSFSATKPYIRGRSVSEGKIGRITRPLYLGRPPGSRIVTASWAFYFYDLRAQIAECLGRPWTGKHPRQIQNTHPCQGTGAAPLRARFILACCHAMRSVRSGGSFPLSDQWRGRAQTGK